MTSQVQKTKPKRREATMHGHQQEQQTWLTRTVEFRMVRNNGEELYMCFMYKVKAIITEISVENEIIRNKKKN